MSRAVAAADLREVCARIEVPTLLIYGDADARAPAEVAQALHEAIADARLLFVPGAGHIVNLEAPDLVNAEIRRSFQARG